MIAALARTSRHAATGYIAVYKRQMTSNGIRAFCRPSTMFSNFAASYATTAQLVVSLASILLVYGIYKIFGFIYDELTSPLRHVPGPPNPSFIYGSFKLLSDSVSREAHIASLLKWMHSE